MKNLVARRKVCYPLPIVLDRLQTLCSISTLRYGWGAGGPFYQIPFPDGEFSWGKEFWSGSFPDCVCIVCHALDAYYCTY